MEHKIQISVTKQPKQDGLVSCKTVRIKERLFKKLFGEKQKVVIIAPSNCIQEISICEKGGEMNAT